MQNNSSNSTSAPRLRKRRKFSLVNLYYVFAILAAIAAVVYPLFTSTGSTEQSDNFLAGDLIGNDNSLSAATASGEGSSAANMTINGDYYTVQNGTNTPLQDALPDLRDFSSNDDRLSYTADLIAQADYQSANIFLSKFIQLEDLDTQTLVSIRYNRGICNLHLENYNQAVTDLESAASQTKAANVYYALGCAYLGRGDYQEAGAAFDTALSMAEADGTASEAEKQMYRDAKERVDQRS